MSKIIIIISIIVLLLFINNLKKYIDLKENFEFKDENENFEDENFEDENENKKYILPKVIYGFWDDLDTNPVIQSHIRNWKRKFSSEWEIIILNKDNVYKYVDADFLNKFGTGKIDATRFADFLRIDLLKRKGGCWIDASIIILDGKFLDDYYNEMHKNKYDACFYEYKENTILPSQPHIDNWFMMAPKDSKIISDLYYEFERAFDMDFLKYKFDILLPSGILMDRTIGYGDSTYLLQHAIFHYLYKKGNKYNIVLKDASESMYKIQSIFSWDNEKIIEYVLFNDDWNGYYGIKLTKSNRSEIKDIDEYTKHIDKF